MTQHSIRSFAAGVFLSTTLLAFAYYFLNGNSVQKEEITEEDVLNFAKENDKMLLSNKEYEELVTYKRDEEENAEKSKIEMEAENAPEQPVAEKEEEKEVIYIVTIESGMSSLQIASMLERQNIIDDAKEFEDFLGDNDLTRSIQIGTFELSNRMSFEALADTLTN